MNRSKVKGTTRAATGRGARTGTDHRQPGQEGEPLFPPGQIVATPGALAALAEAGQEPLEFLTRHVRGDWGEVPPEDAAENEVSLKQGYRLLSAYTLRTGQKLWIITEADRSATMLLRPEEY
jgi:hypothetical protein